VQLRDRVRGKVRSALKAGLSRRCRDLARPVTKGL
jgi:hypothetical protein